jgi:alkyldihydroxyacetonephosphate synthase
LWDDAPRWSGWGPAGAPVRSLPETAAPLLRGLGVDPARRRAPVELDSVRLAEPALPEGVRDRLARVAQVHDDGLARVLHAAGKSYFDLVRLRAGDGRPAPDAVVVAADGGAVEEVLRICTDAGVAVVPFGGGTSVVGGVEPLRGDFGGVVSLDLGGMGALLDVDERSLVAVLGAGMRGPAVERALGERGLTLGHFPQSWEYASVGGMVATRSAGQASTGYGRIDELVRGVDLVAPGGRLDLAVRTRNAAGPELRELVAGSEGVLGVITQATLSVRPRPAVRRYEGWSFPSFRDGVEAFRAIEQEHVAPDLARLSDEAETAVNLAMAGGGRAEQALGWYLKLRRHNGGCVAIVGWEGTELDVGRRRAASEAVLRRWDGIPLGARPGQAWTLGRYDAPYLRDALLDHGVLAETLETATTWTRLHELHDAVAAALHDALAAHEPPPVVLCHVSHLYPVGASLYFTVLARQQEGEEVGQWRTAKDAACEAILRHGGTITHHHAIGRDHAAYLEAEIGPTGVALLRAAKAELDPAGILNPGKLLPPV